MKAKDFERNQVNGNGGGVTVTPFNTNRAIKKVPVVGDNMANLGAGNDVNSFLEKAFFPFTPATISIGGSATLEKGGTYTPAISGSLSLKDQLNAGVSNRRSIRSSDSAVINSPADNNFAFTAPAITDTESYRHYADVDNNGNSGYNGTIQSGLVTVNLVYPLFYGVSSDPNLSGSALYNSLTKLVTTQGTKVLSFSGANVYLYIVYPSNWSDLSAVVDNGGAGDNVTSAFTTTALRQVDSVGLTPGYAGLNYKFNRTQNLTTVSGDSFQFSF